MMVLSSSARLVLLSALVLGPAPRTSARAADAAVQPLPPTVAAPLPPTVAAPPQPGGNPGKPGKPGKPAKKAARPKTTTVVLFHLNRRNTMALRLRDAQGQPVKGQQKRFNRFLRCHYTNKQHAMHPRLMRLVYQTGRHWPGKRIEIVSGYRNPNVAKNPRSPHMKGLACDFRVVGVTNTDLRDYLRGNMKKVGVGYYPNSSFVHLDVRKDRSAFWIDYSGPGERSLYSESPAEDLKTGRADQYHPTKIGDDWVNDAPPDGQAQAKGEDEAEAKKTAAGTVQGTPPSTAVAGQPPKPQ